MAETWRDLGGLQRRFGPGMARAVEEAMRRLATVSPDVEAALAQGNIDAALDRLPWAQAMTELERSIYRMALVIQQRAAQETMQRGPRSLEYRFDLTNLRAIRSAQKQAGDLIREVTVDTRQAIRGIIVRGQQGQLDVRDQARLIREHIGLTRRQANAVFNYRQALIEQDVAPARVERLTQAKHERTLRLRAMTIARTETIRASNQGTQEVWRQGVDQGVIPPTARRVWVASPDACPYCQSLDGKTAGMEEHFQARAQRTSTGQIRRLEPTLTPPAHISCRCSLSLEVA